MDVTGRVTSGKQRDTSRRRSARLPNRAVAPRGRSVEARQPSVRLRYAVCYKETCTPAWSNQRCPESYCAANKDGDGAKPPSKAVACRLDSASRKETGPDLLPQVGREHSPAEV